MVEKVKRFLGYERILANVAFVIELVESSVDLFLVNVGLFR